MRDTLEINIIQICQNYLDSYRVILSVISLNIFTFN